MNKSSNIDSAVIQQRRDNVFLILAGLFLGTLSMLNILGISKFIKLFSIGETEFIVAIGVLPYHVTFLCTDLISELYGEKTARFMVWVGVILNIWLVFILWVGNYLPSVDWYDDTAFVAIKEKAFGAVGASMVAYLVAQFTDVYMYHFWKRFTKGKHLWLRNNGSTLISQLVDSTAVILVTHYFAGGLGRADQPIIPQLLILIGSSYVFILTVALLDTGPLYVAVKYLSEYLQIDPMEEHRDNVETDQ